MCTELNSGRLEVNSAHMRVIKVSLIYYSNKDEILVWFEFCVVISFFLKKWSLFWWLLWLKLWYGNSLCQAWDSNGAGNLNEKMQSKYEKQSFTWEGKKVSKWSVYALCSMVRRKCMLSTVFESILEVVYLATLSPTKNQKVCLALLSRFKFLCLRSVF